MGCTGRPSSSILISRGCCILYSYIERLLYLVFNISLHAARRAWQRWASYMTIILCVPQHKSVSNRSYIHSRGPLRAGVRLTLCYFCMERLCRCIHVHYTRMFFLSCPGGALVAPQSHRCAARLAMKLSPSRLFRATCISIALRSIVHTGGE